MSTQQLSDVIQAIINDWVKEEKLFTALDVSVEVKQTLPYARHREVRDIVRAEYSSMQNSSYGRTDIDVTLADGTAAKAILYHPLSDSWDLDAKYSAQQRAQIIQAQPVVPVTPVSVTPVTPQMTLIAPTAPPIPSPTVNPNKHLWDSLFDTQPSLFPRR